MEMREIAKTVASRFASAQELEETFGLDDSEGSETGSTN